ncbi:hypothetical protein [Carnobacterium jeotgali]|uniref:hypothetical protein n=1 Tax=Carnobacterium jeotgali TaxID=545534 RepID=UPI000AB5D684|nr:hypothetical protein [Carnobacterium jeotgali]
MDKHQDHNKMDHNNKNHSKMDHSSMNHAGGHAGHHAMMIKDFKKRFWVSLILAIPISLLSPMVQMLFGYEINFLGDDLLLFVLSTVLFFYGGKPFLTGAWGELKSRTPAMMMLISLAIITAYVYSTLTTFFYLW